MAKDKFTPAQRTKFERAKAAIEEYGLWQNPNYPLACDCIVGADFMKYVIAIAVTLPDQSFDKFINWLTPNDEA